MDQGKSDPTTPYPLERALRTTASQWSSLQARRLQNSWVVFLSWSASHLRVPLTIGQSWRPLTASSRLPSARWCDGHRRCEATRQARLSAWPPPWHPDPCNEETGYSALLVPQCW